MARVTQPSGEIIAAHSNSTKVAREPIGTASSKSVIHRERHVRTQGESDMRRATGIENDAHWPPPRLRRLSRHELNGRHGAAAQTGRRTRISSLMSNILRASRKYFFPASRAVNFARRAIANV